MFEKLKQKIEKRKNMLVSMLITCGLIAYNTVNAYAASGVSGNLSNASNGAQQEALGWIEAIGGLGIVIGGIIWLTGNNKLAKTIISSVAIGYILVKFAPDLWKWFTGIF